MAYHKIVLAFLLTCLLLLFFLFTSPSNASSPVDDSKVNSDEKVNLSLYYESLCPYCANFIVNQLGKKVFGTDLISIVNLRLVPWGNTERTANGWICQHGPDECILNTVEACAINIWPDLRMHFKFINCIEHLHLEGRHTQWQSCFGALQLNPKHITDCYKTKVGVDLELKYADETDHLNPPHRYVPWVLVNNKPLEDDYQNYVAHVCNAYKGRNKPKACNPHSLEINLSKTENSILQVCYAGKTKTLTSLAPEEKMAGSAKASFTYRKKETSP